MHRLVSVIFVCLVLQAGSAWAQPAYRPVEVFGAYSLLPANADDFPRQTSHGLQGSASVNLNEWFGIVGDFGVQFNTSRDLGPGFEGRVARTRVAEYLVGPRFVARSEDVSVYGHGLFGVASGDAGDDFPGFSDTALAFGGGVGIDIPIRPRLALRVQFDLLASFADIVEGNTRFGVGFVVGLDGS